MEGIRIRVEESRQTSHSPVGKFDKNHFGSASQQVFVLKPGAEIKAWVQLELELEELAFGNLSSPLFYGHICHHNNHVQSSMAAALLGLFGGFFGQLRPGVTFMAPLGVDGRAPQSSLLPAPFLLLLPQPTQVIMQIQKFGAKREKFHEFSICQLPTANWPRECDTRLPWILFNCDFNLPFLSTHTPTPLSFSFSLPFFLAVSMRQWCMAKRGMG